jgi:hypothetical protein
MSTVNDTDLFLVERGATNYQVTALDLASYTGRNPVVTAVSLTAVPNDYIIVTASGQTITLPATPYNGAVVTVVVAGTFLDTIVARNGANIMGLAEDITLDKEYAAMQFTYDSSTTDWRLN